MRRWQKQRNNLNLKFSNKLTLATLKKTYFYWFLLIWKTIFRHQITKNLLTSNILNLFFLEKNKFKSFFYILKFLKFGRKINLIHKKTLFLKKIKSIRIFNKFYLPEISNKWFLKRLFRFWHKKFMKSKLNKINYYFMKGLVYKKWRKINKWEIYYISWNTNFSTIKLPHINAYFFWKRILNKFIRKSFFWFRKITNFLIKSIKDWKNKKYWLSAAVSKKLRKIFFNKFFKKKFIKFRKKFFVVQFKTSSFYKKFLLEFYVPFQILFFWKSILRFTNSINFILPIKMLNIQNFKPIIDFFYKKFKNLNLNILKLLNTFYASKNFISYGFDFFNNNRLEKILLPVILFFSQFQKSYILPQTHLYVDTFLTKKKFLPFHSWKFLQRILLQSINAKHPSVILSDDTENNNLMTLLFYKFLDEIFELMFSFAPGKLTFLGSKAWVNIFFHQLVPINFWTKNWEFNEFYSLSYAYWNRQKAWPMISIANWPNYTKFFFDFHFFFWKRAAFKYWKLEKLNCQKPFCNLLGYISKTYFLSNYIWAQVYWRFFYARAVTKKKWFKTKIQYGWTKIIYDSYFILQNKFWSSFQERKSIMEHILSYGFAFRTGSLDFSLDWNFLIGYKGTLAFKLKKKKFMKISTKKFYTESVNSGFFAISKSNSLFSTFFTFLNRSYLLQYLVQFGHTKANYNTAFKDYLVMVYNEWFILNILNTQLNLKRNFKTLFKMFFLGGFVCLVGTFNILLEGLVGIYGAYANQPYTRYIWVNGLFSNFDKIFQAIQTKIADLYAARIYLTWWMVKELITLWFSMWGIIQNLNIDISFFPSLFWSSWVFLETSAKFYPTMTTSNTECFLPTVFLDYTTVSNDYSLLSLSLYVNLLIVIFKKTKLTRQMEFSVYPQKLITLAFTTKKLPLNFNLKFFWVIWQMKVIMAFTRRAKFMYFEKSKLQLASIFKYLFIFWRQTLLTIWKQNFWKFFHFSSQRSFTSIFF